MTQDWQQPRRVFADGDRKVWRGGRPARPAVADQREVVVRVTRRTHGARSLGRQFAYLTRQGRLEGEMSNGRIIGTPEDMAALRERWLRANTVLARGDRSTTATQSVGIVLSMPAGTPLPAVTAAARAWAHEHLSHRTEWLMVPHADRAHPHVHFAVRAVQQDGRRLTVGPQEVQAWRVAFARELGTLGIEAEATPRREKVQRLMAQRQAPEIPRPEMPELRMAL